MHPFHLGIAIVLVACACGCAIESARSRVLLGPTLYRARFDTNTATLFEETRSLPLQFEAGRQWGLNVGYLARMAASCPLTNDSGRSAELASRATEGRWEIKPFYFKVSRPEEPELVSRVNGGLALGAGIEANHLTIGFSRAITVTPLSECWYEVDSYSGAPISGRFRKFRSHDEDRALHEQLLINQINR